MLEKQGQTAQLCRQFTASRESFDGVALFEGEACMGERRRLAHAGRSSRSDDSARLIWLLPRIWNFFLGERI